MAHQEQYQVDGWLDFSDWIDDVRDSSELLSALDEDPKFKQQLLACQSNGERFQLIWNNKDICQVLQEVYQRDKGKCQQYAQRRTNKSRQKSKEARDEGNKYFKSARYLEALEQYTQAVIYAPYPSQDNDHDDSLALALSNRSAALYSLTRYRLCLLDIELAIKYGYPEPNKFKLLIRKIKCLHILSVWTNDVEQIKANLKEMLKRSDVKDYVKSEISNMFEFLDTTQPEEMPKDELDVVDETVMKISNTSKTLSQAADCVEMSYDPSKGRYLLTNKDISYGRLLLAEEPYVCLMAPNKRSDYCYNCLGGLHSCGIGCPGCTQVIYCSESCQAANVATHAFECNGFLDYQEEIGIVYIVTLIMFKIKFDLSSVQIYNKKSAEKKSLNEVLAINPGDWPDLVYKNDYASVLSLMDHSSDYDYDDLMSLSLTAAYLMFAFKDHFSSKCASLSDEAQQVTIGSIVLRHLLQLRTNLISILDQDFQNVTTVSLPHMKERPVGVGVYPTISLLNHSCSPNILSIFHRNKFLVRASKSLDCGTEINYCYGPSVTRMSRKDRKQILKEQYFFECDCDCCKSGKENEARAYVCPACSGPLIISRDMTHRCLNCLKEDTFDIPAIMEEVREVKDTFEIISEEIDLQCLDKGAIERLSELKGRATKIFYEKQPIFAEIQDRMLDLSEIEEKFESALDITEGVLNFYSKTYGPDSYEFIMKKLEVINKQWELHYKHIESKFGSCSENMDELFIEGLNKLIVSCDETKVKLKDLLSSTNIAGAEKSFEKELKFLTDIQNSIIKYRSSLQGVDEELESEPETT